MIKAGIHKMLVRIANWEDPDQTASAEAVWSRSALFVSAFLAGKLFVLFLVCEYCFWSVNLVQTLI